MERNGMNTFIVGLCGA